MTLIPASADRRPRPVNEPRLLRYLLAAVALAVSAVVLAPIAVTLIFSFGSGLSRNAPLGYLPPAFGLDNYARLFRYNAGLWTYLRNSLGVASLTVLLSLGLAIPAGYGLARFPGRYKQVWFLLLLLPLMIPYQVLVVPLYLDIAHWGLANSWLGLALVHTLIQLPFSVFVLRLGFAAIPADIEEAAIIDGSGSFRALLAIFLPLAVPAIVTVALFAFIASWNEFLAGLIFMNTESAFTLPVMLATIRGGAQGTGNLGPLQAGVMVAILPCMAIYLLLQRYFTAIPLR